jgi:hypothetical protein
VKSFDDFLIDGNECNFPGLISDDYVVFYSKDEQIKDFETFSIRIPGSFAKNSEVLSFKTSEYDNGRSLGLLKAKLLKQAYPSSDVYFVDVEINELASRFPILFRKNQLCYDTAFQMHRSILEKIEPKEVYPGLWICPNPLASKRNYY